MTADHQHTYPDPAHRIDQARGIRRCESCEFIDDLVVGRSTTIAAPHIVQLPEGRFRCEDGKVVERLDALFVPPKINPNVGFSPDPLPNRLDHIGVALVPTDWLWLKSEAESTGVNLDTITQRLMHEAIDRARSAVPAGAAS